MYCYYDETLHQTGCGCTCWKSFSCRSVLVGANQESSKTSPPHHQKTTKFSVSLLVRCALCKKAENLQLAFTYQSSCRGMKVLYDAPLAKSLIRWFSVRIQRCVSSESPHPHLSQAEVYWTRDGVYYISVV